MGRALLAHTARPAFMPEGSSRAASQPICQSSSHQPQDHQGARSDHPVVVACHRRHRDRVTLRTRRRAVSTICFHGRAEALALQVGAGHRQAGNIASRARKALDEPVADWITEDCEYNWRFRLSRQQGAERLWALVTITSRLRCASSVASCSKRSVARARE